MAQRRDDKALRTVVDDAEHHAHHRRKRNLSRVAMHESEDDGREQDRNNEPGRDGQQFVLGIRKVQKKPGNQAAERAEYQAEYFKIHHFTENTAGSHHVLCFLHLLSM